MFHLPPLANVTADMEQEVDCDCATMGWNLFHDRRISSERFEQFSNRLNIRGAKVIDARTMQDAIGDYHTCCVRKTLTPDFLSSQNENNFHDDIGPLPIPHSSKLLVRVLDLGGLHPIFEAAKNAGVPEFESYDKASSRHSGTRLTKTKWLNIHMEGFLKKPEDGYDIDKLKQQPVLTALLAFMNSQRHQYPFEPTWTTLWSEFKSRDWLAAGRWQQLVGISPSQNPTWLLLLRYPIREIGRLVRPTQLDGGWYPPHFPVPFSAKMGHAMEMNDGRPLQPPLPEYIHQQIDHEPEHLFACGYVGASFKLVELPPPQRRHYHVLEDNYSDTDKWIQHPHPAFRSSPSSPPTKVC